jgi:hypothetical protein
MSTTADGAIPRVGMAWTRLHRRPGDMTIVDGEILYRGAEA